MMLLLVATLLSCDKGEEPPKADSAPPEPPAVKTDVHTPEPEPIEPEESEVRQDVPKEVRCQITIEGEGPKLVKAAVVSEQIGEDGKPSIQPGEIDEIDGRTVTYDCPGLTDQMKVDLVAQLEGKEGKVYHWNDVEVSGEGEGTVKDEDRQDGAPKELSRQELEFLAEQSGIPIEELEQTPTPPPVQVKSSSVTFMPFDFPWIELELKGKKNSTLTLKGKKTKMLPAGSYTVSFRDTENGKWDKAGLPLEIEAGKSYEVKMTKRPPHIKITSK